mmetsp:Transcript_29923/g.43939  ORF Transcript_29923/g.43939 Transcript_29923/m.43939 type:complete len:90 (+) Transcript_29923:371-640(+)
MRGETEADFGVGLESPGLIQKYYVRWFERVFWWEQDSAVIDSTFKFCFAGSSDCKMPFKHVIIERRRIIPAGRVEFQLAHICLDAAEGG